MLGAGEPKETTCRRPPTRKAALVVLRAMLLVGAGCKKKADTAAQSGTVAAADTPGAPSSFST